MKVMIFSKIKKAKNAIIIFLMVAIFLTLNLTGGSRAVKDFFYGAFSPVQKYFWQAGNSFSDFSAGFFNARGLKEERDKLWLENQNLLSQIASLEGLKKENQLLKESLGLGMEKEFNLELAHIVGKDVSLNFLLIDKGYEDGIKDDLPVVTAQKTLVGKIKGVYRRFSRIQLCSNKDSSFDIEITGKEIYGIARGDGGSGIILDFIPFNAETAENDLVITSSASGFFPAGIFIGKIGKIEKSDVKPFQTAEVFPAFDIKNLAEIFVIKDFKLND
ncbi:MAG: rod shape-determining protein MreC [Candidatus Nealsonbacteria bacterium CG_4_8_14_3_um_filter_39_7]|uniref:Cell shape-determining protein MreC n=1 Tax=Candidatus Nealsonbacteria bacterium CG23_combo_of_CG06-09_8_20_14_all_39_17 TaxID=1974722 RepID=A0A2G9YVA2_9BACT|nr:MAG: rod shape-determining protein MreC [Candidatus Nealsonbacteria bacterium CG23_combo_of_CG06-09_8_20_14_all_39_17]PIU43968.1 MAG: rod shape-determining protein MreC [Candidatus Nealsonbacteria bacterium CG07_land_8_20_14_0_80_39_13]PIW91760.1 MAG: rod shape-determining protein MreC [Candidatus Nealsonbacteria bacterium CG_4_8_14_3_um_filter_39_7]